MNCFLSSNQPATVFKQSRKLYEKSAINSFSGKYMEFLFTYKRKMAFLARKKVLFTRKYIY